MGDLSLHFSRSEFRCHGYGKAGHPAHVDLVDPELVRRLEVLRSTIGRPLTIISGHRCPWENRRVGGAANSQHLYGKAADIPSGYASVATAASAGFTGIGNRGAWAVHVDVRPSPARWTY